MSVQRMTIVLYEWTNRFKGDDMSYYRVCPFCGANLDPGETCECKSTTERNKSKFEQITTVAEDGQMVLGGFENEGFSKRFKTRTGYPG